jgi:dihydrofolate reductase
MTSIKKAGRVADMGKIIITENVSLDGVVQDPMGEEGFRHGGWGGQLAGRDREEWAAVLAGEAQSAAALLLGRRSEEWFAVRWLSRSGPWADRLNGLPKYVVSSTLAEPRWSNTTVLRGDVVSEVGQLKQELDGDIVVYASFQLARTLLEHGLADELRLMIFPVALGEGGRLFDAATTMKAMRLIAARTVGESLAFLAYAPA